MGSLNFTFPYLPSQSLLPYHFALTDSNLAALDGGITPLPLAALPEIPHAKDEDMRFDDTSCTPHESFKEILQFFFRNW